MKIDKKDLSTKANIATMATEVANEIDGHNFQERLAWIEKLKAEGNKLYQQKIFDQAIAQYLKALTGLTLDKGLKGPPVDDVEK